MMVVSVASSRRSTGAAATDSAEIVPDDSAAAPPSTDGAFESSDPGDSSSDSSNGSPSSGSSSNGSDDLDRSHAATPGQLVRAYEAAGIPDAKGECMVDYIAGHNDSFSAGLDDMTMSDMQIRFALIDACSLTDDEVGM